MCTDRWSFNNTDCDDDVENSDGRGGIQFGSTVTTGSGLQRTTGSHRPGLIQTGGSNVNDGEQSVEAGADSADNTRQDEEDRGDEEGSEGGREECDGDENEPHLCICSLRWAISRCMNSMVEAGTLLGLLQWLTRVLAVPPRAPTPDFMKCLSANNEDFAAATYSAPVTVPLTGTNPTYLTANSGNRTVIAGTSTTTTTTAGCDPDRDRYRADREQSASASLTPVVVSLGRAIVHDDRPLSDLFTSFLHDTFHHLACMKAPSASEQPTPGTPLSLRRQHVTTTHYSIRRITATHFS
jgi:hypothetical protein